MPVLVIVFVILADMGVFMDGGQGRADLDQGRLVGDDGLEFRQIALQSHSRDEIESGPFRLLEIVGLRLEMMRIAFRTDQIDHLHFFPAHLPREIAEQGMQDRDFEISGGKGQETKDRGDEEWAKHGGTLARTLSFCKWIALISDHT